MKQRGHLGIHPSTQHITIARLQWTKLEHSQSHNQLLGLSSCLVFLHLRYHIYVSYFTIVFIVSLFWGILMKLDLPFQFLIFITRFPSISLFAFTDLPHNAPWTSIPKPKYPSGTARWPSGPQSCFEEVCRVQYRLVSAGLPSYLWRFWRREPGHPEPAGGAGDDQKAPKIWQLVC